MRDSAPPEKSPLLYPECLVLNNNICPLGWEVLAAECLRSDGWVTAAYAPRVT